MAPDDTDENRRDDDRPSDGEYGADDGHGEAVADGPGDGVRTQAIEEVDQRIVDLLSWILDTETRAKIYVHLLSEPGSTSEEVARGTGLYPSTVREALAELHAEQRVRREKRASEGAGNNPYEYTAIQPSELVGGVVDQVQQELNTIFTLDRVLDRDESEPPLEEEIEPVTITVDETSPTIDDTETDAASADGEEASVDPDDAADEPIDSDEPTSSDGDTRD